MTTNVRPRADAGAGKPPPRRSGWLLALLLLLLLLGAGAAGVWWVVHKTSGPADGVTAGDDGPAPAPVAAPACSDDADPKYLEHLDFGPPVETPFDRRRLDALPNRPIPEIEKYPWQPAELVAVLGEHRMRGQLFAASPDGKLLAVGSPGNAWVRIGDTNTVHEKAVFAVPAGSQALAWSSDGDSLAVSCGDGVVRLYDIRNLDKTPDPKTLEKPTGTVTSLSYSADGKYLLGGDNTPKLGVAWVWDVGTLKAVQKLQHTGPVTGVAFSPVRGDYRALTAGGVEDACLRLWDAATGERRAKIDFKPPTAGGKYDTTTYVSGVAFSPDGKRAVSSHSDWTVRLWDLDQFEKDKELHVLPVHGAPNWPAPLVAYSNDGRTVATTRFSGDGVWLWDENKGTQVRQLAASGGVSSVRFLPGGDGLLAFTGTTGGVANVHIHEVETGKERTPPVGHLDAVSSVDLSPDGRYVASGGADGQVRLWGLDDLHQRHAVGAGDVWGVHFLPDAKRVYYYGSNWATLPLADVASGQVQTPPYDKAHNGPIVSAAVTRDGRFALTGGQDGTVRMWRLADGRQVRSFDAGKDGGPATVTLSPDMHRAIRLGGGKQRLLQLRCQSVLHEWADPVAWAPFLPDARVAFFGGASAPVWDVKGDEPKQTGTIGLNLSGLSAGALSGDGKRVAAVLGGKAAVFEVDGGRPVWEWTPPPHFGGVRGVALSPDGRDLLTANGDGTVYVIRLP